MERITRFPQTYPIPPEPPRNEPSEAVVERSDCACEPMAYISRARLMACKRGPLRRG